MTILSEVLQGLFIATLVVTGVTFIVGLVKTLRTDFRRGGGWLIAALAFWFAGVIIDVIGMTLFG